MHTSIEAEYWVVDRDGSLVRPGPLADVSDRVESAFVEPLLTVKTPPCDSHDELRGALVDELEAVLAAAEAHDRRLVPLGTPIDAGAVDRWPGERSRVQERVLGPDFDDARRCAGTHLHVEQANVVDQLNVLTALDPAAALLNSSPFLRGERVADSARAHVYRREVHGDVPEQGQIWDYAESIGEWKRRLARRFDEFEASALGSGVDEAAFHEQFSPETAVWTPVRLREEVPTVEWRAPDAALPSQVLRLAGDVDRLMDRVHRTSVQVHGAVGSVSDEEIELPTFSRLQEYSRAAIQEGLGCPAVANYLERMGFDPEQYDPLSRHFGDRDEVSVSEASELRLRYASLLERDVRGLVRTEKQTELELAR